MHPRRQSSESGSFAGEDGPFVDSLAPEFPPHQAAAGARMSLMFCRGSRLRRCHALPFRLGENARSHAWKHRRIRHGRPSSVDSQRRGQTRRSAEMTRSRVRKCDSRRMQYWTRHWISIWSAGRGALEGRRTISRVLVSYSAVSISTASIALRPRQPTGRHLEMRRDGTHGNRRFSESFGLSLRKICPSLRTGL